MNAREDEAHRDDEGPVDEAPVGDEAPVDEVPVEQAVVVPLPAPSGAESGG